MGTRGRYSIDFEQSDNPGQWERHLVMNSDDFAIAENFYFVSVDTVESNDLSMILGVRLYDHELSIAAIEYHR